MAHTPEAAHSSAPYPPIPCGRAAFHGVRRDGYLYVDKTRFIRELENECYVFFVRPRHFGEAFWLATLECYYGGWELAHRAEVLPESSAGPGLDRSSPTAGA